MRIDTIDINDIIISNQSESITEDLKLLCQDFLFYVKISSEAALTLWNQNVSLRKLFGWRAENNNIGITNKEKIELTLWAYKKKFDSISKVMCNFNSLCLKELVKLSREDKLKLIYLILRSPSEAKKKLAEIKIAEFNAIFWYVVKHSKTALAIQDVLLSCEANVIKKLLNFTINNENTILWYIESSSSKKEKYNRIKIALKSNSPEVFSIIGKYEKEFLKLRCDLSENERPLLPINSVFRSFMIFPYKCRDNPWNFVYNSQVKNKQKQENSIKTNSFK